MDVQRPGAEYWHPRELHPLAFHPPTSTPFRKSALVLRESFFQAA